MPMWRIQILKPCPRERRGCFQHVLGPQDTGYKRSSLAWLLTDDMGDVGDVEAACCNICGHHDGLVAPAECRDGLHTPYKFNYQQWVSARVNSLSAVQQEKRGEGDIMSPASVD